MRSDHVVLGLLWSGYCAVHSALISAAAVNFFKGVLGTRYCFYRLFFNILSLATLIPLILFSGLPRFRSAILFAWSGNWRLLKYSLVGIAVALVVSGARHYSMSQFLGLRQIRSRSSPGALTESGDIDTSGVLGIVRHPWYVAVFLLIWTSDLSAGTVIVNLVLSGYLVIGTLLEERKLIREFGDRYREYQRNVSMFFPIKWLLARQKQRS